MLPLKHEHTCQSCLTCYKEEKFLFTQSFSNDITKLTTRQTNKATIQYYITISNKLAVNLNVLRPFNKNKIIGKVHSSLIVTMDNH